MAGLLVLVAMPIDLLPGLPIDDIGYLIAAFATGKSAFKDRGWRKLLEVEEMAQFAQRRAFVEARQEEVDAASSDSNQE